MSTPASTPCPICCPTPIFLTSSLVLPNDAFSLRLTSQAQFEDRSTEPVPGTPIQSVWKNRDRRRGRSRCSRRYPQTLRLPLRGRRTIRTRDEDRRDGFCRERRPIFLSHTPHTRRHPGTRVLDGQREWEVRGGCTKIPEEGQSLGEDGPRIEGRRNGTSVAHGHFGPPVCVSGSTSTVCGGTSVGPVRNHVGPGVAGRGVGPPSTEVVDWEWVDW